jgi:hypothetical protein
MITVSIPTAGQPAKVVGATSGPICATGTAVQGRDGPTAVLAKVYPTILPVDDVPAVPPADAVSATLNGTGWGIAVVPGAACGSDPSSYPNNTLAVWARYSDMGPYELTAVVFLGKAASTNDCGAGPN